MNNIQEELCLRPEDCLLEDWVCAKMVPHWDWTEGLGGHQFRREGGKAMLFELMPSEEGRTYVVWKRVR